MSIEHKILWQPSEEFKANSNLKHFEQWVQTNKNLTFDGYEDMWKWSIENIEEFWESIWQYFDVISHSDYSEVLSTHEMPGAEWFTGATLNYSEHIFRRKSADRPALIFQNENYRKEISWEQLEQGVIAIQQYLIKIGIKKGDCVAAYLPNIPEAMICFLAVNLLGAVWSSCSPDFGEETVVQRFTQINPKVLITVDGYQYNGKSFNRLASVAKMRTKIESIEHTILVKYSNKNAELPNSIKYEEIIEGIISHKDLTIVPVEFNHPIWVLYSSGTTGKPKPITHSHGGVLLEHLKYMSFHNNVKEGDNYFWFTTTGWVMWNITMSSLLQGATFILYDGSPAHPNLDTLWKMAEELPIHHFGTSPAYLTALMKSNINLAKQFDLADLKSLSSTGAPLTEELFEWIYKVVDPEVWLCSMSGGTDVGTAFVGGNPYHPVEKGLIQSRALGVALYAYDENGNKVSNQLGEMVIEKPMPSMPIYFWNDENGERYKNSYFTNYPGKWRHGDWIEIFDNGALTIQGRSDSTLNRQGIRIGTAEIYNVVDSMAEVKDSIILFFKMPDGSEIMPLFIVVDEGVIVDDKLKTMISSNLKSNCSPRHVPDRIIQVPDIPYTLSGKKMEVPLKKIFMGMDADKSMNKDAMRNPEAMNYFIKLANEWK